MHSKLKSPIFILFITIFFDLLGFGILIPVIPSLFANPNSPSYLLPVGTSTETGYILMGLILALYFVGQFFMSPILGELSDRFGRKKIILASIAGSAVSYLLFGFGIFTKSILLIFIARAVNAVTSSIISVSQATIADISHESDHTKNFGVIGAAFGMGFVVGPFLGGTLSNPAIVSWFGPTTPFWFASALACINAVSVILFLPETNHHLVHRPITATRSLRNILRAFHMRELRALFTTNFFFQAGFTFFTTFFSIFLITRYNFSQQAIGNYFAFVGIWIAISQGFLLRLVPPSVNSTYILRISLLATSIFILLQFFTGVWWELLFIAPFLSIANGFSMANIQSTISKSASRSEQGEIMGLNTSIESLARAIPPLISGFIAAVLSPSSPLLISALLIFIAWAIFILTHTTKQSA